MTVTVVDSTEGNDHKVYGARPFREKERERQLLSTNEVEGELRAEGDEQIKRKKDHLNVYIMCGACFNGKPPTNKQFTRHILLV